LLKPRKILQIVGQTIYWRTKWLGQTIYSISRRILIQLDFFEPKANSIEVFFAHWRNFQQFGRANALNNCLEIFDFWESDFNDPEEHMFKLSMTYTYFLTYSQKTTTKQIRETFLVNENYEISKIESDLSINTLATNLIAALTKKLGSTYIYWSKRKFILDVCLNPKVILGSLQRSFKIEVLHKQLEGRNDRNSMIPIKSALKPSPNADLISRALFLDSIDFDAPTCRSVAPSLRIQNLSRMKPPILLAAFSTDLKSMFNFLGVTNKREVVSQIEKYYTDSIFLNFFLILKGNKQKAALDQRLNAFEQQIALDYESAVAPLVSHKVFSFTNTFALRNVNVLHQRFITIDDKLITIENAADVRADFIAGLWMYLWSTPTADGNALILNPYVEPEKVVAGIAGFGRCDSNWFHFLVETFPRILASSKVASKEVPIYVQSDIVPAGLEAISAVTGREVLPMRSSAICFDHLFVGQGVSSTLDTVFLRELWGNFDSDSLIQTRDSLLKAFPPEPTMAPRIMMLRRSSYRKIRNLDRVIRVAEKHGFKTVAMEKLSLHNQISLIYNAEVVLTQGGAALTNLMFAGNQTRLIGLVGPALNQKRYWETYLNVFNIKHQFIIGENLNKAYPNLVHNDFTISVSELQRAISNDIGEI